MSIARPLRIVLPGGSGQVGNILARHFHRKGDSVAVLTRRAAQAPWRMVTWDGVSLGCWVGELEKADVVINLAGRSVNGASGSGRQFVSWIHQADYVRAIDYLIAKEELAGCVNIAAPGPLPNSEFMGALRDAWGRRIGLPAAQWMLEIGAIFLRTETELILKSRRVVPGRLLGAGFQFRFSDWPSAAQDLVEQWRKVSRSESDEDLTPVGKTAQTIQTRPAQDSSRTRL